MAEPFRRVEGGIRFDLPDELVTWLSDLPRALDMVGSTAEDPAADRLRVPVYLDDPEADAEWWQLMEGELGQSRAADRSAFEELLASAAGGTVASEAEAEAFLRVLVEGRLVLAARVGLETEDDYETLGREEATVLAALAELQALLIRALDG